MTIAQVVTLLQEEKQKEVASRFPCRAIMVKNIKQYCELLSTLQKINNIRIVQSDELFSNADVMPNFENLKESKYHNEWLILTGVSEYLRLFSKKEAIDKRFANLWTFQAPASSTGRIIIPLWGCEAQWFDKALNLNDDVRQEEFYITCAANDDESEQPLSLLVLSGAFERYKSELTSFSGTKMYGLKFWYDYWSAPDEDNKKIVLITKRYNSIATINGIISVHVIANMQSFIRENMPGASALPTDAITEDMQSLLFRFALQGIGLEKALLAILNVSIFSGTDIMGKWRAMKIAEKQIVALWIKLHPSDTYINHCFHAEKDISRLPDAVLHEIFKFRKDKPEWVKEYHDLATVMSLQPDDIFFAALDDIPTYEDRLDYMLGNSREERVYLLRMVGKWMRDDYAQVSSSSKLSRLYPELYAYLCHNIPTLDKSIQGYMSRYKSYKLENALPIDEDVYFGNIQVDSFDYRYAVLSENVEDDTVVLWIDALGVEWLTLLKWSLENNCTGSIRKIDVVQANLPTETCFNDIWNDMKIPHEKLDKLDKLAHKGVIDDPDYYACIEDQLAFVSSICQSVNKLMMKYHRVIITGDHGTSRLAARFFHIKDGLSLPKGATVYSHGRYCELPDENTFTFLNMRLCKRADGKQYVAFTNYDHFRQSGFAAGVDDENAIYGEVHGGATPEEMLVPIIVIDSNTSIPISASWSNSTVKIKMRRAKFLLHFNKKISFLQVKVDGIDGNTSPSESKNDWEVTFEGIMKGTYQVQVYANHQIVSVPDINVLPALGGGEGDLP